MAGVHSPRSPSGVADLLLCPGRVAAQVGLPDRTTFFAAQGTVFHEVVEICLRFDVEPVSFLGKTFQEEGYEIEIDEDAIRWMTPGIERVRELSEGKLLWIELRVDLSDVYGIPGEGGTLDIGIIDVEARTITIFDWKFGAGIPVEVADNVQLKVYGLGFWNQVAWMVLGNTDDVKVRLHIEQPRVLGGGAGEWWTTMDELLAWQVEVLQPGVHATLDPNAHRVAGEKQCRMCRARRTREGCYAYNELVADVLCLDLEDIDDGAANDFPPPLPHPSDLTTERRAYITLHADLVRKWLDVVHGLTLHDALHGKPTPGLKPIAGREGKRAYRKGEEDEAAKIILSELGDDKAYDKKLISPTQAEKVLSPEAYSKLRKFVTRSSAKPALAPEHAKAERLTSLEDDFTEDDLIGDQDG
jgi:hypothetical protein